MNIALIRTMDSQGRIVIPAEIRKQMKLSDGDALELENVGMELLLRKCPTHLNGKEEMASYLSVLYSVIHCGIAICSEAHILVSAGIYLPEGTPVTEELAELVADGQELISAENCPVYPVKSHICLRICLSFKSQDTACILFFCADQAIFPCHVLHIMNTIGNLFYMKTQICLFHSFCIFPFQNNSLHKGFLPLDRIHFHV